VAQLRDWYVDVGVDKQNVYQFRLRQSNVPYSYENMQSSSNRLPLDRADATKKGSGDYGMLTIGTDGESPGLDGGWHEWWRGDLCGRCGSGGTLL
jgi:hypothetical protein